MSLDKKLNTYIANSRISLIILVSLAIILNWNTLKGGYVLDDVVVLTDNSLVKEGVKGIPDLLTKEYFYGLAKKESDLSGGRYRPLALVVFAIEYEVFGFNPFVSHLINVLLFAAVMFFLFKILNDHILKNYPPGITFLLCMLFLVHPIHTEVIANIKSRDELISLLLLIASGYGFIKYAHNENKLALFQALFCFFLALLTRESAIPFIIVVPMISYYFYNQSIKTSLKFILPLSAVFVVYMLIRLSVVGITHGIDKSILNFPFVNATPYQAFATKVYLLFKYVSLLFYPFPLSFDYGYNEIPYLELFSAKTILSGLILVLLFIIGLLGIAKRSVLSFGILYFFATIFLFSNFIIDIGAPLAERLLFQPSIGFCLIIAYYLIKVPTNFKSAAFISYFVILLIFANKTVARNNDWESNYTLFTKDVKSCPNSVRANLFAGQQCLTRANSEKDPIARREYYQRAVFYDQRILSIYPHYQFIYEDLGYAYLGLGNKFNTADFWIKAYNLDESNSKLRKQMNMLSDVMYNSGNKKFRANEIDSAIVYFESAVDLNPDNGDAWYNLGASYFTSNKEKEGVNAWQIAYQLSPNHTFDRTAYIRK
jgi:tetratricopeptide (TPR) repeat protein